MHTSLAHPPLGLPGTIPGGATAERLRIGMLGFALFTSFFVMMEPAPVDLFLAAAMAVFLLTGLRFPPLLAPMIGLFFLWLFGAALALTRVYNNERVLLWLIIGTYLVILSIILAAYFSDNTYRRISSALNWWTAAATIASIIGIIGYFGQIEALLLYSRAKSTFQDPNVFGPYLVLPAIWMLARIYETGLMKSPLRLLAFAIIAMGIFLSFSRGAWGQFVAAAGFTTACMFIFSASSKERMRMLPPIVVGFLVVALALFVLLSIGKVGDAFTERAKLVQNYDGGHMGRFYQHKEGFKLILQYPLGLGMLQFPKYFVEQPHNTYLGGFVSYGWLGGSIFPSLILITLFIGLKGIAIAAPWRSALIASHSVFITHMIAAWTIDIDHWRHFYFIIGMVWGLTAASIRHRRQQRATAPPAPA